MTRDDRGRYASAYRIGDDKSVTTHLRPVHRVREIPAGRDEQVAAFGDLPRGLQHKIIR